MNHLKQQLLCLTLLVSAVPMCSASTTSKIVPRSQSFNAARQIVGWDNPYWGINRRPQENDYTSFNIIFEYTRTFRSNALTQCLFGNDLVNVCDDTQGINISGSDIAGRSQTDWLAEYFGLPRNFQSTLTFKPTISNYILDFSFYAGLDSWMEGLYFRFNGPFVHTKWNLNAQETVCTNASTASEGTYFQGYFSSNVVPVANLNKSFLAYASGSTPKINNDFGLDDPNSSEYMCVHSADLPAQCSLNPIVWQELCCSRIANGCDCDGGALSRNGFGELRFALGYNFVNNPDGDYHLGVGMYVAAPTGTRVGDQDDCNGKGRYLFEPIVGNGKHWELGAQVTAHRIFWRNENDDTSLGMYIEANVTHLFAASQTRCFDLCSAGSNSRYMIAEKLALANQNSSSVLPRFVSSPPQPAIAIDSLGLEFATEYAPVANITSRNITSTIGAQGDVAFSLAYQSGNFQWDVGYNFWGRSCEKLSVKNDCCNPALGYWALKGDQRVYGFNSTPLAVSLPATDSKATIHTGSNLRNKVDYTGANPMDPVNLYGDNGVRLSPASNPPVGLYTILPNSDTPSIYTSEQPVLIQDNDLDLNGTRGISNKIFTHINWAFPNCKDSEWTPYVGIGAEAEFGSRSECACAPGCNPAQSCETLKECCSNCALSQWGVWLKVGASYN